MFSAGNLFFTKSAASIGTISVNYLIVGGGGAGGCLGGGGGAGGLVESTGSFNFGSSYSIKIGAGGTKATSAIPPTNGLSSIFGSITMLGGGSGGHSASTTLTAGSGGSGGGSWRSTDVIGLASDSSYGFNGGHNFGTTTGTIKPIDYMGGGGGGAGAAGVNGTGAQSGNGGDGVVSTIDSAQYGGGGGGGGSNVLAPNTIPGTGGLGGGGAGGSRTINTSSGTSGSANTGGGGGSGSYPSNFTNSGAGGSGIVLLKIANTAIANFSAGVTSTVDTTTAPGFKIYRITATSTANETVTFS